MVDENPSENQETTAAYPGDQAPGYGIKGIYLKDASFESPNRPVEFKGAWKPKVDLQVSIEHNQLEGDDSEVLLKTTATAAVGERIAYIAEVYYGLHIAVQNVTVDDLDDFVHTTCATLMYPYAREMISDLVRRGGFPQLILMPINFKQKYQNHLNAKRNAQ